MSIQKGSINLNVSEYTLNELLEILDLEEIELNLESKTIITEKARQMSKKYKNNESYSIELQNFFLDVGIELIKQIDGLDEETDIIGERDNIGLDASYFLNPINRIELEATSTSIHTVVSRTLVIDSKFRTLYPNVSLYDMSGNSCNKNENLIPKYVQNECDFSFHLSEPLKNVLSIQFHSAEIPKSWYNIDKKYGTNRFSIYKYNTPFDPPTQITDISHIDISSGMYSASTLVTALNDSLSSTNIHVKFEYNTNSMKIDISNSDPSGIVIDFYNLQTTSGCNKIKINHNLGTILGFNSLSVNVDANAKKQADNIINLIHTKYLYVVVDDYNTSNTCNPDTITMVTNYEQYDPAKKMGYVDSVFIDLSDNCSNVNTNYVENHAGGCGLSNKPQSKDLLSSLTKAQIFNYSQIKNVKNNNNTSSIYNAPIVKDYLIKIPVGDIDFTSRDSLQYINYTNDTESQLFKRVYGNSVNIRKMKIKLLNEFGHVVNLNGVPWSITLIINKLNNS
jgi:hypothetical protein